MARVDLGRNPFGNDAPATRASDGGVEFGDVVGDDSDVRRERDHGDRDGGDDRSGRGSHVITSSESKKERA